MDKSLKGHLLPTNEDEFASNAVDMKFLRCIQCGSTFTADNVHTRLGWRETQITGFCENCFDNMFQE
jgi:hypothetical protein